MSRHRDFVLKRSAYITNRDRAAAVFSVEDLDHNGKEEVGDVEFIGKSLQKPDVINVCIPIANSPQQKTEQISTPFQNPSVDVKVSSQAVISIANVPAETAEEEEDAIQSHSKKSRFDWPRMAKIAAFLLATAGAFSAGKLAAVGITLTVALACKLFARDRHSHGNLPSSETGHNGPSHGKLPSAETGQEGGSRSAMVMSDGEATLAKESKDPLPLPVSNLVMEANGHTGMPLSDPAMEALTMEANGDAISAQRKQLRRLNCIRLRPSASPFVKAMDDSPVFEALDDSPVFGAMDDSPLSSAVCSPRKWFLNEGSSTPTGPDFAGSAGINKQGRFKSKDLLRHLRKKEPRSAPSTPLRSSQEAFVFCSASSISDASDTERAPPPSPATAQRKSLFKRDPATLVAKEVSMADANNALRGQQSLQASVLRKEEKKRPALKPATPAAREDMAAGIITSSDNKETLRRIGEKKQSALKPATPPAREVMAEDIITRSAGQEPLRRRGEKKQSVLKPVSPAAGEAMATAALGNQHSVQVSSVRKRGEMKKKVLQQGRVGAPWIASGITITIAGLLMGRTVAIVGMVCYWYALSLRTSKASGKKKGKPCSILYN